MKVFLASFLVLFLELAFIRWIPSTIRLMSYFSNLILLASFLGIGLGCLLSKRRVDLFRFYPLLQAILIAAVTLLRLEVSVAPSSTSINFSSGTSEQVVVVESTLLLPLLFAAVAALFTALAQRMGREMAELPPLRSYMFNVLGSLAGVAVFTLLSWLELPPSAWFAASLAASLPFVRPANAALLAACVLMMHLMARDAYWSPYYKITLREEAGETVLEVNNIFHQSMAAVDRKEYFYQWPYAAFGDTFSDVLILGSGSGTDVAAALRHGAKRVDAVEIDPLILRLGDRHPERPYADPRVRAICDDARHFLRTTDRTYDLVVFALIDSLTLQSSFSNVRLESYMFTEESFRAVKSRLKPGGLVVIYNYFRQPWLIDRLANTAARVFEQEPRVHVHKEHDYLAVLMAGRPFDDKFPTPPDRVMAYGQPRQSSPAYLHARDRSIVPATDDWPFLYMRHPHLPGHYLGALALVLVISAASVWTAVRRDTGRWSWRFFFLGAGFMLLETKAIIQLAVLLGSTWLTASLVIGTVLVMALASTWVVARVEIRRPGLVTAALLALLAANFFIPIGTVAFESRAVESLAYALLAFSPIFCAGLLFGSSLKKSEGIALDYGANLLGAMVGGVAEYLALVTGYRLLLLLAAVFYILAFLEIPRRLAHNGSRT